MITIEALCLRFSGLRSDDVLRWVANEWVRPDADDDGYLFHDIDVERVRLILELRDEMRVDEESLPIVLGLLDQIYELRRRMRRVRAVLDETVTGDARDALVRRLREVEG